MVHPALENELAARWRRLPEAVADRTFHDRRPPLGAWIALTAIAACSAAEAPTVLGAAPVTGDGAAAHPAWVPRANYKARLEPDDQVLTSPGRATRTERK